MSSDGHQPNQLAFALHQNGRQAPIATQDMSTGSSMAHAPDVAEKMRRAEALVTALPAMPDRGALNKAKEAADAARESTFPKLESGPDADYAAAYAASSLLLAAALLIEAEAFPQASKRRAVEGAGGAAAEPSAAAASMFARGGVEVCR